MLIINLSDLSYAEIGRMIDDIIDFDDTKYYGKIDYYLAEHNDKMYSIKFHFLKKYTKILICEE